MNKMICRMALALTVVSLAGCGLKGPLYFPPKEKKTVSPVSKPTTSNAPQHTTTDAEQHSAQ